jgi:cytochrome c
MSLGGVTLVQRIRFGKISCLVLAGLPILLGHAARADGDAAAGKVIFTKCMACHSPDAGVNKVGPSLHGIVGRPSHSVADYSYSDAMRAYNVTWDAATLDKYLVDPRGIVPGTKMIFAGIKKDQDRQNLISYLGTLK